MKNKKLRLLCNAFLSICATAFLMQHASASKDVQSLALNRTALKKNRLAERDASGHQSLQELENFVCVAAASAPIPISTAKKRKAEETSSMTLPLSTLPPAPRAVPSIMSSVHTVPQKLTRKDFISRIDAWHKELSVYRRYERDCYVSDSLKFTTDDKVVLEFRDLNARNKFIKCKIASLRKAIDALCTVGYQEEDKEKNVEEKDDYESSFQVIVTETGEVIYLFDEE